MNSPLMAALELFEAAEANLVKLERLWDEVQSLIPTDIVFGDNPEYEDRCRSMTAVLAALPKIDGWKPDISPPDANEIAQSRLDAKECGEPEAQISVENWIVEPGHDIREYRFRFNQKRRELIRDALVELIDAIDADLREIRRGIGDAESNEKVDTTRWDALRARFDQIKVLLGSSVRQPAGWSVLGRHLHFGMVCDFNDIEKYDWPHVKNDLRQGLYGANEPLPVQVEDLASLVAAKPRGPVTMQLDWTKLNAESFERLIFTLISDEPGYENPEWLMRTNAPDRGRDLSVTRVIVDSLAGTLRLRVVIQCKHWLGRSITLPEVSAAKEQMALWDDPRVDVLVVATSGRFTADAVQWIEKHNAAGHTPRIEMWPESHLERLLAARPALIAEFKLR
jgi:hypothetical protein